MKPTISLPWLAFSRLLGALWVVLGTAPVHAAPEPVDPLVGNWFYLKDHAVTFNPDGTATWDGAKGGTWEYLHNPEVQRHYRIIWGQGKSIDALVLQEDGQHARVTNQLPTHEQYTARRAIPDKPTAAASTSPAVDATDPVLGGWLWAKGRPVTFKPDGTVVSEKWPEQGVWEFLHNQEAERKYRVTWKGGRAVDTLSYTRGATAGHVTNDKGGEYDVHRSASASPAPSDADAHPFGVPGH